MHNNNVIRLLGGRELLASTGIAIDHVNGFSGDLDFHLDGEHVLGISPDVPTVVPTSYDGARREDTAWRPATVGYLPPSMRQESVLIVPTETILIRFTDQFFRNAARETIDTKKIAYRPLDDVEDEIAAGLFKMIGRVSSMASDWSNQLLLESLGTSLSVRFMQILGVDPLVGDVPYHDGLSRVRLRRVLDYIDANIHREIRLAELADIAALSPFHFARAFKKSMHISPVKYVWHRRVEASKPKLRNQAVPIAIVAYDCGFSSQSHFTNIFKRMTGLTPTVYRASLMSVLVCFKLFALRLLDIYGVIDLF